MILIREIRNLLGVEEVDFFFLEDVNVGILLLREVICFYVCIRINRSLVGWEFCVFFFRYLY